MKIAFTAAEKRLVEFAYQNLLFPSKPELNRQEEIGLRNLLESFEAVGTLKPLKGLDVEGVSIETDVEVEIKDERDFKLFKQLVEASRANGVWVREKLRLIDKLEAAEKAEQDAKKNA